MKTKVLVTGAAGYIGGFLSKGLLDRDDIEVYVLAHKTAPDKQISKRAKVLKYYNDPRKLKEFFLKYRFDGVIHLAAVFVENHKADDIGSIIDGNIRLGMYLLEYSLSTKVKWFVNTASFWQHYNGVRHLPNSLYAASKLAFEDISSYYAMLGDLKIVTLELFGTYGPKDQRRKIFTYLNEAIESKKPLKMSPGKQLINIVYIKDVVNAYMILVDLLIRNKRTKSHYSVFSKDALPLRKLVKLYLKIRNESLKVEFGGLPYRKFEYMKPAPNYPPLPGWTQEYSLTDGIREMLSGSE